MASTVAERTERAHLNSREIPQPRMAKAVLKNVEMDYRQLVGRAIQRAVALVGWTQKEAAGHVGIDQGQFARWINGQERPQLDKLWSVPALRVPLVQGFAEQCEREDVEIRTVITLQQKLGA